MKSITPPSEHRIEKEVLVCDPKKADQTPKIVEADLIAKASYELHQGFELLKKYKLSATFYGSARHNMGGNFYEDAQQFAERLSKSGFAIITGGADGIMGAANKGAFEAGGPSIGLNIELASEQHSNQFVTEYLEFDHFFTRKFIMAYASELYVFFPGGFGTLDELFEVLTLIQTKKIKRVPVLLFGKEYWAPLIEFIEKRLCATYKAIDKEDTTIFTLVDTVEEAYEAAINQVNC